VWIVASQQINQHPGRANNDCGEWPKRDSSKQERQ
jgi:hypothetical protein